MTTIIAVCVQKGGTGKTTSTLQLSDAFARMGKSVLVIDLDPQSNTSHVLSPVSPSLLAYTTRELLLDPNTAATDCIQKSVFPGVDIICSSIKLARAEPELFRRNSTILSKRLRVLDGLYDYILLDCPPNLGRLTGNALCAADYYLIPLKGADQFALDGLDDLEGFAAEAREDNDRLRMLGAFFNMYDGRRSRISGVIESQAIERYGDKMFKQNIPHSALFSQTPVTRQSAIKMDPHAQGSKKLKMLAKEILHRLNDLPESEHLEEA